jgi:hypothetical protein
MNINIIIHNGILDSFLEPPERKVLCQVNREFRRHFEVPGMVTVSVSPGGSQRVKTVADLPLAFHQGLRPTHTVVCAIAGSGSLEVLQHLQSEGLLCSLRNPEIGASAARGEHLKVLQWLHANGCPWDSKTCAVAAGGGHLEILQWLHANGCPWYELTCSYAARNGHLEILQWAHANGCPWDERTCTCAAGGGHLEVLQWARANGCPWDHMTREAAFRLGQPEIFQWARANGCT